MNKREILFRGKCVENGEWAEGYYTFYPKEFCGIGKKEAIIHDTRGFSEKVYIVDHETVCQYTGLTDKNDRKIFEGDIVEFTDCEAGKENYAIFWNQVEWGTRSELGNIDDLSDWDSSRWEVIGNIFDNPELLE